MTTSADRVATAHRAGPTIPFSRALRAEFVRGSGSSAARFALFGLALALVQGLGWWFVATAPVRGWPELFGWQTMYATGLLAPVSALLAGLVAARESTAREGGTTTRPLSPSTALRARSVVAALQLGTFHAAVTLPVLGFGTAHGLPDPPVGRVVTLWLVLSGTALLPAALGYAVAARAGLLAAVGAGLVWQVVGTLTAESPHWWLQPWSWAVHAAMPVLRIHANGIRLEPGAAASAWNPWLPALASLLLAVGVVVVLARGATAHARSRVSVRVGVVARRRPPDRPTHPLTTGVAAPTARSVDPFPLAPVVRGRPRPVAAALLALRGTLVYPLLAATLVLLGAVGVIWDAAYVRGFATWLVVPIGCCVLACLLWAAHEPAWRGVSLRARPAALAGSLGALGLLVLAIVVGCATLVAAVAAGPDHGTSVGRFALVLWWVGVAALVVDLWLVTRFGPGVAVGATLVVLVVSLVLGGSWLADGPAWFVGVFGWPSSAATTPRVLVAVGASLAGASAAGAAWAVALRRAAARPGA